MKQTHLYNELVRCYSRTRRKLQNLVLEGKNLRKQDILQRRIRRLFNTLTGLKPTLKLGMSSVALFSGMILFQPNMASAQTPAFGVAQTNPFGLTDIGKLSIPAFADLDNDGDIDLLSSVYYDGFFYFQNTGTVAAPSFAAVQFNPFGLGVLGEESIKFDLGDLDSDGDIDIMAGAEDNFFYIKNTGTASSPQFAAPQQNAFGLDPNRAYLAPSLVDLDADGDLDLMVGSLGVFAYYENTGTSTSPAFGDPQDFPFGLPEYIYYTTPTFVDIDADGDMDLMSGEGYGNFRYFENTGSAVAPAFAAPQTNPFNLSDIGRDSAPSIIDLDGDGDIDLISGSNEGNFFYFKNNDICTGITVFADTDGDGYGDPSNSLFAADCVVPEGYSTNNTDRNDTTASAYPGATEFCDNVIDDDCDGAVDENCEVCDPPANLYTTNVTNTSAALHWAEYEDAIAYQVKIKPEGNNLWLKVATTSTEKYVTGLASNTTYLWKVRSLCDLNPSFYSGWSSIEEFKTLLRISEGEIGKNAFSVYPNPAQDQTTIHFTLHQSTHVSIKVYDVSGKEMQTLLDKVVDQGDHSLEFSTNHFAKGVYLVKMISESGIENQKLIVQ